MAEILGAATTATKFFLEVNQISIDNWTFKLFYKATTTLLLACSVVASSKQFFGDPINCEVNGNGVNIDVLQAYCWMYSTFNIPLDFRGACAKKEHDGTTLYNSYYQWVSIFLVVCAIMFYVPRSLWLMMEGGLMKFLAKGTTGKIVEDADEKRDSLIRTFHQHLHNKYNTYAAWFFCCEQMNFLVVSSMWFITNKFLKYKFLTYGPEVVDYYSLPPEERELYAHNPMCESFPRIAACNYIRYGSGGGQETKNAICILGLNMINDKIFLILWFWYAFLTILGAVRLFYRTLQVSSKRFRFYIMRVRIHRYFKSNRSFKHVQHYVTRCSIGDWFVLYQMSRNMNRRFFSEFLMVLSEQVNPCPGVPCREEEEQDEDEEAGGDTCGKDLLKVEDIDKNRKKKKREDSMLSLHSNILDLNSIDSPDGDTELNSKKDLRAFYKHDGDDDDKFRIPRPKHKDYGKHKPPTGKRI